MNRWILMSGILSTLVIFLHVIGGGNDVHKPVLDSELSVLLKAYSSILWHAVTVVLLVNSAALIIAAMNSDLRHALVYMVASQYLAFAGVFIFYGLSRLATVATMPQWVTFIVIPAIALWGLRVRDNSWGFKAVQEAAE